MISKPYTLHDFLTEAKVPRPAAFAQYLEMAFQPRADQVVGLNKILLHDRFGLFDDPGCVSADTEFLHPTGWKRIDQWDGELVAQFDVDLDSVSFVEPLRYVKEPCSEMLHLHAGRGIDQMLSADHRVLTYGVTNRKRDGGVGATKVETAQELFDSQTRNTGRKFRTAFHLEGKGPLDICDADLRLMVAVIADGHMPNLNSTVYMRLKKPRKIDRLRALLDGLGYPYKDVPCKPEGFRRFTFTAPRREKHFTEWWWGLSPQQLAVVVDEAQHWDGSRDPRGNGAYSFHTRVEASADFIQFAASAVGRTANKHTQVRADGSIDFTVRVTRSTAYVSGKPNKPWITKVENPEGFKYCFQVPSGFLVLRRNGKVFVTGNCGKTVQLQAAAMQMIADGNMCLLLMPPVLLGQFVESLCETFTGPERYISWHVLNDPPKQRELLYQLWDAKGWPQMLLMTYEMFVNLVRIPKGTKGRPELAYKLRELYRIVQCDEGHKLCAHTTILHPCLDWHCGEVGESYLTIATGTPMPTTPLNAYGLIHLINPTAYRDFNQFERKHAIYKRIKLSVPRPRLNGKPQTHVQVLDGFKGQEEIRKHLYRYGRRVIKEQVLDLCEPQIIEVPVVLGKDHMTLYKKLEKERILEYQGQIVAGGINENNLRNALLRIVTNPEAFIPEGKTISNMVLETVRELIASHNDAKPLEDGFPNKIVLFCNLRATAAWLKKEMAAYGAEVMNGETSDKEYVRKRFLNDPTCRVLVANPESAGFGLNLQGVCCTAIYVEPTGVPGEFKQSMERFYRNNQKYVVQAYILRASGTIAPRATKEMLNRMAEINKVNLDEVILSTYFRRA